MTIHETDFIDRMTAGFVQPVNRLNRAHEADAELISLTGPVPPEGSILLAATTDTIAEEIAAGLYDDPYQIGWMAVTVNLSDLAAVGAKPVGVLISEIVPDRYDPLSLCELQRGIRDACSASGTCLLGGDTNRGDRLVLTGTALGTVDARNPLTRRGCMPGHLLFTSGPPGRGNAYALARLGPEELRSTGFGFRPTARIREGLLLPGCASACIDSSDGFLAAIDQLGRINNVGFQISRGWEECTDTESATYFDRLGIPEWIMLAGCHGDFELVFTIPAARREEFLGISRVSGWEPIEIGVVIADTRITLPSGGSPRVLDTAYLRNLGFDMAGGVRTYLQDLLEYHNSALKGV